MSMDAELLGRLIRKARKAQGLSREELAIAIGVSVASIRRWETGKTNPLPAFRKKLEEILCIPRRIIIEEDHGVFVAYCPDTGGIYEEGATREEAMENAYEALSAILEARAKTKGINQEHKWKQK